MIIAMIGQKGLPARSGGIERHVSLLSEGLAARGHRVIVYGRLWYVGTRQAPGTIEQRFTRGIHTKHLDAITHSFTALLDARKERPDVVHIHGTGIALLTPLARLLMPKAKIVVTFHCIDRVLSKWNRFAKLAFLLGEWMSCHAAHQTITVSQELMRYCLARYDRQVTYITHPFRLAAQAPTTGGLSDFHLQKDSYLLFVGRLIASKQTHALMDAYALVKESDPRRFASVPLVIVGGDSWNDGYAKNLSQKAASISGVKMLGERSGEELAALQAHALAHVFPSSSEGLSLSLLEACAYERPVVAVDLPQNREVTGGAAIEVRADDVSDLGRALLNVVRLSKEEREALGKAAGAHVRETFSFEDRIDDVERVYSELCSGKIERTTPHALLEFTSRQSS